MEKVRLKDLGRISYKDAWELQERYFNEVVGIKLERREKEAAHENGLHYFLYCEHKPVFTLGRNGDVNNLLLNEERLAQEGIEFFKINRGGDITFHGPGQIVGYPILDLDCFFTDIGKYLRLIEEGVILTLAEYGLEAERLPGATGVWLDADNPFKARKICAIGIRASRWVTMHGFALNVNTDLSYFEKIVPCGISDKAVTSLQRELGRQVDLTEVKERLLKHYEALFGFEIEKTQVR